MGLAILWTDGGFTKARFIKPAIQTGAAVITRLRKDAALQSRLKNEDMDDLVNMAKEFTFAIRPPKNEDGLRLW
jgi:hypothetical protein